jgi:putative membrane protein
MMKTKLYAAVAASALFSLGTATAQTQTTPATPAPAVPVVTQVLPDSSANAPVPKDFVQKAFQANEFEIAASELATKKASHPGVKAFAKQAVDEKIAVREDMTTAIQSATSDMQFSQDYSASQKAALAELTGAKGKAFDDKYLKHVSKTLDQAVAQFEDYATNGTDPSIKTFASNTLPKLKANQAQVNSLLGKG